MADNIHIPLFYGTALEEALLRAILSFNEAKTEASHSDMLQKALLSLIIEGDNKHSIQDITKIINGRFNLTWSVKDTECHIGKLYELQLVDIIENKVHALEHRKDGRSFIGDVINDTNKLIERIKNQLTQEYKGSIPLNININDIIKKALSTYFRYSGLEFVGLQKKSSKKDTYNAVEIVKTYIPYNKRLCELLIRILADTLYEPSEENRLILEKWARAYVAMQIIGFDPLLANFKENRLRGKSFVIDTDVILYCITKNARFSSTYRIMIDKLKSLGCKLFIPKDVIVEVENHCKNARGNYSKFGKEQILNFSDEMLQIKVGNIIVEDYVMKIRENPDYEDYPFETHLENYYDRKNPALLLKNLSDVFGSSNLKNKLPDLIDEEKKVDELQARILAHTEQSINGGQRPTAINEELSNSDAVLYLTICEMNDKSDDGDFFANKTYLLTNMKKGIRSAKEMGQYRENIICSPTALLSILMENGQLHTKKVNIIDLLENPFLVYTAQQIWEKVEPLLDAGARLKYKELNRLRLDVDTNIDRILTLETPEERYYESKRLEERGYFFGEDIVKANEKAELFKVTIDEQNKQLQSKDKTITEQGMRIKELIEENEKLKEDQKQNDRKNAYLERVNKKPSKKKKNKFRH